MKNNTFITIGKDNLSPLSQNFEEYSEGIVLVLDKPYQWTSADAVRKLKFRLQRHFNIKNIKVGHAGTLDPLATGILLICIGKATKQAENLQSERKEYIAEICFGSTTPSFDLEKGVDEIFPYEHITIDDIQTILPTFLGEQQQIPPIYSAKFIDGMRAYERARQGEMIELKSSTINIYGIELLEYTAPKLRVRIECSKGTYIRAFARDIGARLNSGAHLTALKRTSSGLFTINQSFTMEESDILFKKSV